LHVARVKLAVGPAWWQTWRAKCALAADGAVWGAVREHAGVLVVVSSVVRVAARVARPGDRRSYRISSGRRGRGPGSIHNSPADGREKIRRFLIVMALARLGTGLGLISQPLSPPLSLLFSFLFAPFGSPISLGGQPASMSSRRRGCNSETRDAGAGTVVHNLSTNSTANAADRGQRLANRQEVDHVEDGPWEVQLPKVKPRKGAILSFPGRFYARTNPLILIARLAGINRLRPTNPSPEIR